MDALDLLADFASFLGTSGVVFSPPVVGSNNGHHITKSEELLLSQGDMAARHAMMERPPSNMGAITRTVNQETQKREAMQGAISAQHPRIFEQPHGGQVLPGDYTSNWFDGRHREDFANEQLGSACEYPEYLDYMPVPTWTDAYTSEEFPSYLRDAWPPYQRIHDINNIAPPAAEVYRGPCRDVRCNCQGSGPQLARDFNAYIPPPSKERRDTRVMFQANQMQRMNDQWLALAAQEEQYRMSQVQQF